MASYLGIDIGASSVRALLLRVSYRKLTIEGMGACELGDGIELEEAIRFAVGPMAKRCDGVAVSLPGEQLFTRRLEIPATAQRQLAEVVPFEIEAQLPFDIAEAVFDFRLMPRRKDSDKLDIFAAVARQEVVRRSIDQIRSAIGVEPELVAPGAFSLGAMIPSLPELAQATALALLDIGAHSTEVVITSKGEPVFARTVSVGTKGLPASAALLARELRQTLSAYRASGGELLEAMYIGGGGAHIPGAEEFLSGELGVVVKPMPIPKLEALTAEQAAVMPGYVKSLSLALGLNGRGKLLNLRQGPLKFERGYGFLRERIPVLVGLGSVIALSGLFSVWAELRSLSTEHDVLEGALALVSKDVLGEEIRDPERARSLLDQSPTAKDDDPLPQVDAFDVMAELAEALPPDLKHDIEELDVQRGGPASTPKVTLHGVVPKVQDAEDLITIIKTYACFQDIKLVKTSQQIGGDGQKYLMEFELRCASPAELKKTAAAAASAATAAPATSATPTKGAEP
jgi:general secretion pathway protein L